jgi:hypothetical protein
VAQRLRRAARPRRLCLALTAPPTRGQKLGLKRRDPDSAGRQYAQHNVAGLPVTMRRAQSEIFATGSIKWQNDALSAAPTEARHGSPPNPLHYASAGAMTQSNKSVGMASDTDYKVSVASDAVCCGPCH